MCSLVRVFIDPVSTAPTHVFLAEQNLQMVTKLHYFSKFDARMQFLKWLGIVWVLKTVAMCSLVRVFIDPVSPAPTHMFLGDKNLEMVSKLLVLRHEILPIGHSNQNMLSFVFSMQLRPRKTLVPFIVEKYSVV